jgi:hypothetical protein
LGLESSDLGGADRDRRGPRKSTRKTGEAGTGWLSARQGRNDFLLK